MNVFDLLKHRGFIYQLTDDTEIEEKLANDKLVFYIGIDPTADSLHIGHLLPLMAAKWLQEYGHKPIILIGGGTAMVGDPSGKTEMRMMLTDKQIQSHGQALKDQLSKFIFVDAQTDGSLRDDNSAIILNNRDWLQNLKYIEFLRDFGRHFSVNKMLAAESVKLRLETGLSFLEFNYSLLQSYDFYILAKDHNCVLQLGGQDQWGNIIAGVDLTRRILSKPVYGMTFPLLTDKQERKFGKTVDGAVWLDKSKTSIFDYYQFWRNVDDADVGRLLFFYTTLPIDEIKYLASLEDPEINRAKEILAFEATCLVHGEDAAKETFTAAAGQFGCADKECKIKTSSKIKNIEIHDNSLNLPSYTITNSDMDNGYWIIKLIVDSGLENSNGAARRLIKGGGAYLNDSRITDMDKEIKRSDFSNGKLTLRSGKKNLRQIILSNSR